MKLFRFFLATIITYLVVALCFKSFWLYQADSKTFNADALSQFMAIPVILNLFMVLLFLHLAKAITSHLWSNARLQNASSLIKNITSFLITAVLCAFAWITLTPIFLFLSSVMFWIPWSYLLTVCGLSLPIVNWTFTAFLILLVVTLPTLLIYKTVCFLFNKVYEGHHTPPASTWSKLILQGDQRCWPIRIAKNGLQYLSLSLHG